LTIELRNNIYGYVIGDAREHLHSKDIISWDKFQPQAMGLSQACRQLRREVLPLPQPDLDIVATGPMLKTYATVLLGEPHKVNGTLTWELVSGYYTFDILPLIRTLAACPNLVVKLSGTIMILTDPIDLLHSPDTNTEITATVKDGINAL
jgi:hypothetical protein